MDSADKSNIHQGFLVKSLVQVNQSQLNWRYFFGGICRPQKIRNFCSCDSSMKMLNSKDFLLSILLFLLSDDVINLRSTESLF